MSNIINIAASGLHTSKKGIKTTAHNISNVNTEGYSRQRVHQQANAPTRDMSGNIAGSGSSVKNTKRVHDIYMEKRLTNANSRHKFFNEKSMLFEKVEGIFNNELGESLNTILSKFYNSFRDLANYPEDRTAREIIKENSKLLIQDFKRINTNLNEEINGMEFTIKNEIDKINSLMSDISKANSKIATATVYGNEIGDLEDLRDKAVKELSKYFSINTYLEDNHLIVSANNVGTLVSEKSFQPLIAKKVPSEDNTAKMEIFYKRAPSTAITDKFKYGKVAAMLDVRNSINKDIKNEIDNIAYTLINSINSIHRKGYVKDENNEYKTGLNFFNPIESSKNASELINISDDIEKNSMNIATALSPDSPGDNRVALAISALQREKIMDHGESTVDEKYLSTIGKIGIIAGKANLEAEQSLGLLNQAINFKDAVTGVSLDEETENMIRYQNAYQSAAKIIQAGKNMFDTILNLKT